MKALLITAETVVADIPRFAAGRHEHAGSCPRIELVHREKIDQCQIVELLDQALGKIRFAQRVDEAAGKNVDLNRGENVLPDGGVIQAPGMHGANSLKDSLLYGALRRLPRCRLLSGQTIAAVRHILAQTPWNIRTMTNNYTRRLAS